MVTYKKYSKTKDKTFSIKNLFNSEDALIDQFIKSNTIFNTTFLVAFFVLFQYLFSQSSPEFEFLNRLQRLRHS